MMHPNRCMSSWDAIDNDSGKGASAAVTAEMLVHLFLPDCWPRMELPLADAFQLPLPKKMNCMRRTHHLRSALRLCSSPPIKCEKKHPSDFGAAGPSPGQSQFTLKTM